MLLLTFFSAHVCVVLLVTARVAISRFERQMFYEWWYRMPASGAQSLTLLSTQAEKEAKLKNIAVETAAAEKALMKLDAELAAWQRILDRHKLVLPGLEGMRETSSKVKVEDDHAVDEKSALPVPKIEMNPGSLSSDMRESPSVLSIVEPLRAVVSAVCCS